MSGEQPMPQKVEKLNLRQGIDCFCYVPHAAQVSFHCGRYYYAQRACSCGTGSGKTKCGLAEDIHWALDYPGSVGYIFEPSYPMMKRILFPTLESKDFFGCRFPYTQNPYVANFSQRRFAIRLDKWVSVVVCLSGGS